MGISFRLEFLLFFLSLSLLTGRDLAAQTDHEKMHKIANSYYTLSDLKMSENGKWVTIRKFYDLNRDTVLIFSSLNTEQPIGCRTKVSDIAFLCNDNLLLNGKEQTELLNLEERQSVYFKGVKYFQTVDAGKRFLLLYGESEENKLELRDCEGSLLISVNNITRFYNTDDGYIYAISENDSSRYDVYSLKDKQIQKIYSTSNKIASLELHPAKHGIMIYKQKEDNGLLEVIFLDLKTGNSFPLSEIFPVSAKKGFSEPIGSDNSFFLKLIIPEKKEDTSQIDIWYGNDKKLEKKFYSPCHYLYYVWEPKEKRALSLDNYSLPDYVSIGNERYFLSFDPFYLQDYVKEETPLKMFVYDRFEDRYTLMDTTGMELNLSGKSEYVLSYKDSKWWVYHIPSAGKKLINSKNLSTPWFTEDGKSVLFEGYGALWRYEFKTGVLSEEAVFEGYETSIVNGEWNTEKTNHAVIDKRQVNLLRPLIIKLYDPDNNVTSYVLWHNGKSKVIIPPTPYNIQFLQYNSTYEWFSWFEESYNMPPRMVFKKDGEVGKVLYQSNKGDKSVLSLKQEIISYTNSDKVPLKGVLYYPMNYNPSAKYPMVVHIYQKQRKYSNLYPYQSYYGGIGFNIRLLLEKGYFVYLPDILIQGKDGTGIEALDCVNRALDALALNPLIDKYRIGLIGHSFGGYETDFIATHSNRFAAFVSGAGHSDIIWASYSFNYNFLYPDYRRIESGQYNMGKSFSEDKRLYFENNPIFYADRVIAPILLWTGSNDKNIAGCHTMAFYTALRRNNKTVIALFYTDEAHDMQKPQDQFDLTSRTLDWFDYFLKGDSDIYWIRKGM